jgi:cysteine synthase A
MLDDFAHNMNSGAGIGQGRVTKNLGTEISNLSGSMTIPDSLSIEMVYRLLDEEGLYMGASSALNVVAAYQLAKNLGPGKSIRNICRSLLTMFFSGKTIVTILCDGAYRCAPYISFLSLLFDAS